MNDIGKTPARHQSPSDSFLGMALAQTFLGVAYGPVFDHVWEAGEASSAFYADRFDAKRTNGRGVYELGVRGKLADNFTRNTSEKNHPFFMPMGGAKRTKPKAAHAFVH